MLAWFRKKLEALKEEKGFSLIELMVVVAIIGILFVVLVPKLSASRDRAREAGQRTDLRTIEVGLTQYIDDNHDDFDGVTLATLTTNSQYVDANLQNDPWGVQYQLAVSENDHYVCIYSSDRGTPVNPTMNNDGSVDDMTATTVYSVIYLNPNGNVVRTWPENN